MAKQLRQPEPPRALSRDLPRAEIRRELRTGRKEHRALQPAAARLLRRRQVLAVGGAGLGAAALAACTPAPEDVQVAQSGVVGTTTTSQLTPREQLAEDLTLLRVAQSIEALAVDAYGTAGPQVTDPELAEVLTVFAEQHRDHAEALSDAIADLGGEPYQQGADPASQPNPALVSSLEDTLALATDDVGILTLALTLENVAAQTYTWDVRLLSDPELRAIAMSIGGVEARHVAVLLGFETPNTPVAQAPFPFGKTLDAVKEGDAVTVVGSGPVP